MQKMEDSIDLRLHDNFSHSNLSETPRASIIDSSSDLYPSLKSRSKHISFSSAKKLHNTQSFATAYTRSGGSFLSPAKSLPQEIQRKEKSLRALDERLNKISEDGQSEMFTARDTAFETAREKIPETYRDFRSYLSTERSTFARQISDEHELSSIPTLRWCAFCKKESCTEVEYKNSRQTFWAAVGIFMLGGVLGCFMLPYMTNSCKEARYRCHNCKHELPLATEFN